MSIDRQTKDLVVGQRSPEFLTMPIDRQTKDFVVGQYSPDKDWFCRKRGRNLVALDRVSISRYINLAVDPIP